MTYRHHVFISYCRDPHAWTAWTRDEFRHLMAIYLKEELGIAPDIFVDDRMEEGADWPTELGEHLATSRIMVPIFSGDYFGSAWCLHELDLMLERSKTTGQARLIVPVVVHDGNLIPKEAARIQPADFKVFRVAYIQRGTTLYQEFSQRMKALAPSLRAAILSAPQYSDDWRTAACRRFDELFNSRTVGIHLKVQHFEPKPLPRLDAVPQLP